MYLTAALPALPFASRRRLVASALAPRCSCGDINKTVYIHICKQAPNQRNENQAAESGREKTFGGPEAGLNNSLGLGLSPGPYFSPGLNLSPALNLSLGLNLSTNLGLNLSLGLNHSLGLALFKQALAPLPPRQPQAAARLTAHATFK